MILKLVMKLKIIVMKLKIIKTPDARLRQKSTKARISDPETAEIIADSAYSNI